MPECGAGLAAHTLPAGPEFGAIYHQGFDGFHSVASGDAQAIIPGLGTFVESWSGYALDRSGPNVRPWIIPGLAASGHTNLTCNQAGAIRLYFEPYFSSASVAGGTGPGAIAHLADLVAINQSAPLWVWSLQISADGSVLRLVANSDSGPTELLAAPIAWRPMNSTWWL